MRECPLHILNFRDDPTWVIPKTDSGVRPELRDLDPTFDVRMPCSIVWWSTSG